MTLKLDYNKSTDLCGTVCAWCGKDTELRYLFPVVVHPGGDKKHIKQLQVVCIECITNQNIPKGVNVSDLPWYDPKGKRIGNEKVFVSFGSGTSVTC